MTKATTVRIAETDLYPPVAAFLIDLGYSVRGEVHNCDLVAERENQLVVVELKRCFNLALVAQAVRRQSITPSVYVAIPRPAQKAKWLRSMRRELAVLRRLEIGLLLVSVDGRKSPVDVIAHPEPGIPRQRYPRKRLILKEMAGRSADFNTGGCHRKKIVTAYRENAIQIACCLEAFGSQTPRALRLLGTGEKTLSILRRNVYGWFERQSRGVYTVTIPGCQALVEYPELAARYRKEIIP